MVPMNVAVVPYAEQTDERDLAQVTAALQVQVFRDFTPIWGVTATVTPFLSLDQVPPGYLALVLVDSLPRGRHGVHFAAGTRPFGLVKMGPSWSLMASHELLEMLSDPWGNRIMPGRSLMPEQGQVEYLLEICDPCQTRSYLIDGVLVSDFVTPEYYATSRTSGLRYSFRGEVTEPRQVLDGGYITWRVPGSEEIWQQFGDQSVSQLPIGGLLSAVSTRAWVDWHVAEPVPADSPFPDQATLDDAAKAYHAAADAAVRYGGALKRDIGNVLRERSTSAAKTRALGSHPQGELALLRALGSDDDLRRRYQADTHAVLDEFGLETNGIPATAENLAPAAVFEWIAERLEQGDVFGDGIGFFGAALWWLAALGGG